MDVESMTCFTPADCEAMFRAATRAASLGTWLECVTMPSFVETSTDADLSCGSANISA